MRKVNPVDGDQVETYAIESNVLDQYKLQNKQSIETIGSQVEFAQSVNIIEPKSEQKQTFIRDRSMKSLQYESKSQHVTPAKGQKYSISPLKGTLSISPLKSSSTLKSLHTRCKTAKYYKLSNKKKSIIQSNNLYRKATIDIKPQDCLSKKALIEAQESTQATHERMRLRSKTKSQPLLEII